MLKKLVLAIIDVFTDIAKRFFGELLGELLFWGLILLLIGGGIALFSK